MISNAMFLLKVNALYVFTKLCFICYLWALWTFWCIFFLKMCQVLALLKLLTFFSETGRSKVFENCEMPVLLSNRKMGTHLWSKKSLYIRVVSATILQVLTLHQPFLFFNRVVPSSSISIVHHHVQHLFNIFSWLHYCSFI